MEKQILDALKNKYKNLGFGEKAFEGVAKYLATTVTEADQIETAIGGVEGLLKSFQGDIDKRVNDAVAKAKSESGKTPTDKKEEEKQEKPDENMPAWAKSILEANKTLAEEVSALKSGKTAESRKAQLETKLKDLPEKLKASFIKKFDRMSFKDDEDFNGYLSEVEIEVTDLVQDFANNGLKNFGPPSAGGASGNKKVATKEEAKGVVDSLMPN